MKKRYKSTIYIVQEITNERAVYDSCTFRFKWCAVIWTFFALVDTAHFLANGLITFETDIQEIPARGVKQPAIRQRKV